MIKVKKRRKRSARPSPPHARSHDLGEEKPPFSLVLLSHSLPVPFLAWTTEGLQLPSFVASVVVSSFPSISSSPRHEAPTQRAPAQARPLPRRGLPARQLSHPVLEGKPNANHVRARISYSRTQQLHNMDIITQCSK
jgi:hypothetical protein